MKRRSYQCVLGGTTLALVLLMAFAPAALATPQSGINTTTETQLDQYSSFFSFDVRWLAMAACWDRLLLAFWFMGLLMATIVFR